MEKQQGQQKLKESQASNSNQIVLSATKNIIQKNKEGIIPQRVERVFQVKNIKNYNYINFSVHIKVGDALVAQGLEHLSNKQGLPRHPGSSPGQGASILVLNQKINF